jgi:O-6-methylguanine DNA methyltransferase
MAKSERFYAWEIVWEKWRFVLVSSARGVRLIDLRGRSSSELSARLGGEIIPDETKTASARQEIEEYLRGDRKTFVSPLDLQGTPFQMAVWEELLRIPYGETRSYGEVAAAVGRPRAARAVGAAIGANPVPIIVPCHRVVGNDGALVGFGGGLSLKERLLLLEEGSGSRKVR